MRQRGRSSLPAAAWLQGLRQAPWSDTCSEHKQSQAAAEPRLRESARSLRRRQGHLFRRARILGAETKGLPAKHALSDLGSAAAQGQRQCVTCERSRVTQCSRRPPAQGGSTVARPTRATRKQGPVISGDPFCIAPQQLPVECCFRARPRDHYGRRPLGSPAYGC
ncbi:hypothetical protein HPB50_010016 [Hyalomma asiaticum]|uniref:Uncharacterized protein n=1 Tax=Hyalomma asiaticum TaxID=266040 RepID=A0ACB7THV5_HYAAI|nr:hypothetical protein HPB50_010016 [Hyalomma asiaticum]